MSAPLVAKPAPPTPELPAVIGPNAPRIPSSAFVYKTQTTQTAFVSMEIIVPKDLVSRRLYALVVSGDRAESIGAFRASIKCWLAGAVVYELPFDHGVGAGTPALRVGGTDKFAVAETTSPAGAQDALRMFFGVDWYVDPWRCRLACDRISFDIVQTITNVAGSSIVLLACHSESV